MAVSPANTARAKSYKMMRVVKSLPDTMAELIHFGRSLLLFTIHSKILLLSDGFESLLSLKSFRVVSSGACYAAPAFC